jgi:hypothetical protein
MNYTKKCAKCQEIFDVNNFCYKGFRNGKQRFTSRCKICLKEYNREQYNKHQIKRLEAKKEYGEINKNKIKERNKQQYLKNRNTRIEYQKKYSKSNKDAIRKRQRKYTINKYHSDHNLKIKMNLSRRMRKCFSKNGSRTIDFIGCSIDDLKLHLEKQFIEGMNWQNYGDWHIDHIRPCCSFDLTDPKQQRECFHYSNLQPLWAKDNLAKGGRYEFPHSGE